MNDLYPVSVIIPAHNAGQTIKRAIDSAFAAGAGEVIVVNDGSTDGTGVYAAALKEVYPAGRYKTLHTNDTYHQPAGVCYARNLGVAAAFYDSIIPLDADDYFLPDGIRALYVKSFPSIAVYGSHIEGEGTPKIVSAPPPERLAHKNLTGATYLFSQRDWERAGGYRPDFNIGCEDWAFMAALASVGVQLVRVDEPIYVYAPGGKRAARCMKYTDTIRQLLAEHYPAVFNATNPTPKLVE
jgi:glycosyltransferase involved in cell wall biosynthesis